MSKQTLIQHYHQKVDFLLVPQIPFHLPKNEVRMYFYGKMEKTIKCAVLIEFDDKRPASGIYYGCKVPYKNIKEIEEIDQQWKDIVEQIKNDFGIYWNNFNKANNRILSCDHEDKKHYWPFWIRLNDDEDIYEAVKGVQIIIQSLLNQGFSFSRVENEEDVKEYVQ